MSPKRTQKESHSEQLDDWTCADCFKSISSSRPPVYNPNNCSCSEIGFRAPLNDPHLVAHISEAMNTLHLSQDVARDAYPYDPCHQAPTVSSDGSSVRAPDGPERLDPNARFLPLGPAIGLGEDIHRRRASFDGNEVQLAFVLRRYWESMTPQERSYHDAGRRNYDRELMWLRQDTFLVGPTGGGAGSCSVRAATGSSEESMEGSMHLGSESPGWRSQIDPMKGIGHWTNAHVFESWPDTLMIDDSPTEDDDDDEAMRNVRGSML